VGVQEETLTKNFIVLLKLQLHAITVKETVVA